MAKRRMKFQQVQQEFIAAIRDPEQATGPDGIEAKRMKVYAELFFKNISSTLSTAFPVLYQLFSEHNWDKLVRDFMIKHQSHSPYFHEIPQEFLFYLEHERDQADDYLFLLELAHYEWAELALEISPRQLPTTGIDPDGDLLQGIPIISPLAWILQYQFPVHKICPEFTPDQAPETPTFIIVYRDKNCQVNFMEINAVSAALLVEIQHNRTPAQAFKKIIKELNHDSPQQVIAGGLEVLQNLRKADIILGVKSNHKESCS